jgi:hypothetical protein
MNKDIVVRKLQPHQVHRARALVHLIAPETTDLEWKKVVVDLWSVAAATDHLGYVRGLAVSQAIQHPVVGMLLDVPILVAGSVVNDRDVARALFFDTRLRARRAGCTVIRFWTTGGDTLALMNDRDFFERWDHGLRYPVDSWAVSAFENIGAAGSDRVAWI